MGYKTCKLLLLLFISDALSEGLVLHMKTGAREEVSQGRKLITNGLSAVNYNAQGCGECPRYPNLFVGNPPITPLWAFRPWVWEDVLNTKASITDLVDGYLSRNIPVGAVIIDSPWQTYYNSFKWDEDRYPDPQQMIDEFHARGIRVVLWITGFVNKGSPDYSYVKSKGYAINDGQTFRWWKGRGVHIDFTNPDAMNWWHSKMDDILKMGIDGWKVDKLTNKLPHRVNTYLGRIATEDFKHYYYADFFDHSTGRNPQAVILARPYSIDGGLGAPASKLSVGWCGDFSGDFKGLDSQKEYVYESALMGYGAPGVEVGGYFSVEPTKKTLIRYAQFGALTPLMENGGDNGGQTAHLPWYWGSDAIDIYRYFATLHSEMAPYLFSYGVEAHFTGQSIIRDPDKGKSQHKLGEELLISVVNSGATTKIVYFPSGSRWIDYWDEATVYDGGTSISYSVPLNRYPIFIRSGAIIPMDVRNGVTEHGDSTSAGRTTLLIYPHGFSDFTFHRPLGDGIDYEDVVISVNESQGMITVEGDRPESYRLRVKSFVRPETVSGADDWSYDTASQTVIIDKVGHDFTITIDGLKGYLGLPPSL
jgi:alpha-glucosidase (family GH31 glycosyl hydrolase)